MSNERHRILEMLASGEISAAAAEKLLDAIGGSGSAVTTIPGSTRAGKARDQVKHLCIVVESGKEGERVNVRVPLKLLRAGIISLSGLMSIHARQKVNERLRAKGIDVDLSKAAGTELDELIDSLAELEIDVVDGDEKVRIWCE